MCCNIYSFVSCYQIRIRIAFSVIICIAMNVDLLVQCALFLDKIKYKKNGQNNKIEKLNIIKTKCAQSSEFLYIQIKNFTGYIY